MPNATINAAMFGLDRVGRILITVQLLCSVARVANGINTISFLAASGGVVPAGSGQFDTFGNPALNAGGQVAFQAGLRNTSSNIDSGIYLYNGSSLVELAREGATIPEGNGQFSVFGNPIVNSSGQLAFQATLLNTFPQNDTGIYFHNGTVLLNRAREDASAPEGNGQFAAFSSFVLNSVGQVAFQASLRNTSSGSNDDSGIYLHNGAALLNRARENATVPGGNGQFASFGNPVLNSSGQLAFQATLRNTSGGTNDDSGVYVHDGTMLLSRARENGSVPEGNGTLAGFGEPNMSASGQVAFQASLRNTSGLGTDDSGIYLQNGTTLINIARENATVPEGNGKFATFGNPVVNSNGQVAFQATLRNTNGGSNNDSGIYLHNGSALVNIARENSASFGGLKAPLGDPLLNANGLVAFFAGPSGTGGIYLADSVEFISIIHIGDFFGTLGTVTGLSPLTSSGGEDGRPASLDDLGRLTFRVTFSNSDERVVRSTPWLFWRSAVGGQWDTANNWTLGLRPSAPHDVSINPTNNLTVVGPTAAVNVRTLEVGGGIGIATLALQNGGNINAEHSDIRANGVLIGNGAISGNFTNSGRIAPGGSPGMLQIGGSFTQYVTGKLQMELASLSSFDRLLVDGNLVVAGTLEVSLLGGYMPTAGTQFDILDFTGCTGMFNTLVLPSLDTSLMWHTAQLYTNGILSVVMAGDFSADGVVNTADYVMWRKSDGTQAGYNKWRANFGKTLGGGASAGTSQVSATVPEPTTLVQLVILANVCFLWSRASK